MAKRRNLLYALLAVCLVTSVASVPFLNPSLSIAGAQPDAVPAPLQPPVDKVAALYSHELKRALGPLADTPNEMGSIADEAVGRGQGSGEGSTSGSLAGVGRPVGLSGGGGGGNGSGGGGSPGGFGGLASPGFGSTGGGAGATGPQPGPGTPTQGEGTEEETKPGADEKDDSDRNQQPTPFDPLDPLNPSDPIACGPDDKLTPDPDRNPPLSPPTFQPDPLPPEFPDPDHTLPPRPPVAVSEPSTLVLLMAGGIGLAVARRIQRR